MCSGWLVCAGIELDFDVIGVELNKDYFEIANRKITVTQEIKEKGYSETLLKTTKNLFNQ